MSHLNITFNRFDHIGTVMHYILVISVWYIFIAKPLNLAVFSNDKPEVVRLFNQVTVDLT